MEDETNRDELFRQYLDGELNDVEESKVLHMIADDPDMREVLHFERTLFQAFGNEMNPDSFTVPENFSDSVMSSIAEKLPDTNRKEEPAKIFSLFSARQVTLNPVYAAAAVILLSLGFGYLFTIPQSGEIAIADDFDLSTQMVSETESKVWIRFVYFDETAESIEVAGDFSDWDPVELSREFVGDKQVWTGLIPVTRGEHRYMFVKDGDQWLTDPLAEVQQDDGFGNKNAVLYL
jgi:hypothetical protein